MEVNLADGSIYPASIELHDRCVNMLADLWNAPKPKDGSDYIGTATIGSTEACLLAGLALKFRWRKWYAKRNNLTDETVIAVKPNIVISSCYQAAWEKLFRYFDVTPRFMFPTIKNRMKIDPTDMEDLIDDKTIAVVGILGNHYNGAYDPIWDMDKIVSKINAEKGLQVGIHVDAASGGFVAPFQDNVPPFDFRLTNVLTISASGHKFGESVCGTGWVVFRQREDLAEHIAVKVTYLGGVSDSMTLNFSRPATGPYVQMYKLLRLGLSGYKKKVARQLSVAQEFREHCRKMKCKDGKQLFEIFDGSVDDDGNDDKVPCLPVFSGRLNPALNLNFDDFSLQHAIAEFHWYVSAYRFSFEDFSKGGELGSICKDEPARSSMFRVVFKSNLTHVMMNDLCNRLDEVVHHLQQKCAITTVRNAILVNYGKVHGKHEHANFHIAC